MSPAFAPGRDDPLLHRTLFAAYPDGLIVCDAEGHIVAANPAASHLLGYAADELVGMSVEQLVPDAIRSRHAAFREGYAKQPQPRPMGSQMDLVARRRDGTEVMVEIALSPLQSHGYPLVVAAIRGIGDYPRVRQALQRARYAEKLAQLGRMAVDASDPQALLAQLPPAAAEALEVDAAVVHLLEPDGQAFRIAGGIGAPAAQTVGALRTRVPGSPLDAAIDTGAPAIVADLRAETRYRMPTEDPAFGLASCLVVPLSDRGRTIGALSVHSKQPNRFGDDELRFVQSLANLLGTHLQRAQSEEALNHAARLESVGQLTGGIAHDFNNLLTVIQGNLQVIEELPAVAGDEHAQQLVGAAMRASRRGAELTGKLLAFSRRQVLDPTTVDLHGLIGSLADMLRRTLDQRIRIEVDVEAGCPRVRADPGQLESALLNIAINARDAMPDGGRLRFRAARCDRLPAAAREMLEERDADPGSFVAIEIADTGSGMPEAVRERAFEPFFTTKEPGRGTGLGLSTVYGFVRQSHGAVTIGGSPGAGTTLSLFIPRVDTPAPARAEDHAVVGEVPAGLRVLLVEDDAEVRAVALAFLKALRCDVSTVASGEQALAMLDRNLAFDLLMSDIALGAGMRGTALAARSRERLPHIAVLLVSGFSEELLAADRDAPADWELLPKPYTREALAQGIARALAALPPR
jgi:PAS domain S-box-containing protein